MARAPLSPRVLQVEGAGLGVMVLASGQGWVVESCLVFSLDSWLSCYSMFSQSQAGISMDSSGLDVVLCSWLLRSEVSAGPTVTVQALTLGSFMSLLLLMSQLWIWAPVFSSLGNCMGRGAWWATQAMGSQGVRHDLMTKQQQ